MFTGLFIYGLLMGSMGYLTGFCFKGLNPFKIVVGLVIILTGGNLLLNVDHLILTLFYAIGIAYAFGNPFKWIIGLVQDLKMNYQLYQAKKQFEQSHNNNQSYQNEEEINRQKDEAEADIRQKKQQAHDEIKREEEKLNKQRQAFQAEVERLKRAQEEFMREQQNKANKKESSSQSKGSTYGLNPKIFNDACEILGVKKGSSLADFKKAYRHMSNVFHPDKFAQFEGVLKTAAAENYKMVNVAWETVKARFR